MKEELNEDLEKEEDNKKDDKNIKDLKENEEKEEKKSEEESETIESKAEEELAILKEKLLRIAAEYDNYRKRTEKEKAQIRSAVVENFVVEFLPVIDSIEMAFDSMKIEDEACKKGIEMTKTQLLNSLKKLNIESFGKVGEEFNPELHSAISHTESENNEKNTVSCVFQKGYKYAKKIIRHAAVQVTN
ncbi:MAG: nucleotide exchange factor GrpE [Candidatus Improbicoccus pseudotrichonymphae]|uniref:Protein GrpE n=1 Tax=Candidatus Improbicoccus pseudotrichonymphae TaxID=3033792 RepID=A0AA48IGK8_9FIRM|nr:MAG: nucleotide exchange factor GrpE [Candidatus Improbicoccus pseudotrichonymphae]